MVDPRRLATWHGAFNVVSGLWPLLSVRSFEAVFGPKTDRWLAYTVAGLLVTNGGTQLHAARTSPEVARTVGVGTALTLLAIDAIYVPRGRIRWTYLVDAAMELGWLTLWARARTGTADRRRGARR